MILANMLQKLLSHHSYYYSYILSLHKIESAPMHVVERVFLIAASNNID